MLSLYLGGAMLLALFVTVYIGMKNRYSAIEGLLAIVLAEILFIGIALVAFGLIS